MLALPALAMALWGAAYVAAHLQTLFPAGTHAQIDRVYALAPQAQVAAWALAAAWALYGLRKGKKTAAAFAGVTAVAGALDFLPLIVVTLPWSFAAKELEGVDTKDAAWTDQGGRWNGIVMGLITTLLAGPVLVTFAVNLSYYAVPRDLWFMNGLCFLLAGLYALYAYTAADATGRLKAITQGAVPAGTFALLAVMLPIYALFVGPIGTFADKLAMKAAAPAFAALLTTLLFAVTQHPAQLAVRGKLFWQAPLGKGWSAWLKALVIVAALRSAAKFVREGEQDIAWEVLRDVTNVLTPLLVLILVAQCVGAVWGHLRIGTSRRLMRRFVLLAAIVVTVTPLGLFRSAAWTRDLEQARPFSVFTAATVRHAFELIHLPDALGSAADDRAMRRLVDEAQTRSCEACRGTTGDETGEPLIVTPTGRPPHIFVFLADAVAKDRMGVYGHERDNTPNLAAFAKDARRYDRYFAVSSATFQNIVTFFSGSFGGRRPKIAPEERVRLCDTLVAGNYKIFAAESALNLFDIGKHCPAAARLSAEGNAPEDFAKLEASLAAEPERPHFVYFHVKGGHNPWSLADADMVYGSDYRAVYDAMIRVADRQFGELVSFLRRVGVYDDTVTIFTADHGIGLGFHYDKSSYSNLFAHNLAIPFLMRVPGEAGRIVTELHSHLDFAPTMAHLALGRVGKYDGISLFAPPATMPRCVFAIAEYKTGVASMCADGTKLIWDMDRRTLGRYSLLRPEERDTEPMANEAELESLALPLAAFVARGRQTYIDGL